MHLWIQEQNKQENSGEKNKNRLVFLVSRSNFSVCWSIAVFGLVQSIFKIAISLLKNKKKLISDFQKVVICFIFCWFLIKFLHLGQSWYFCRTGSFIKAFGETFSDRKIARKTGKMPLFSRFSGKFSAKNCLFYRVFISSLFINLRKYDST